MTIDKSFARAALVLPREFTKANFYIIGGGGTGSFAALNVARLCFEMRERGKAVELTIIDPDRVEANNIPRSNFCAAEIGRFKAQTLAERISQAWGLETGYACERFDYEKHIKPRKDGGSKQMTIFVGCVDNHLARREINRALQKSEPYYSTEAPNAWWIDGGNGKFSGQVLIGSTAKIEAAENYFATPSICRVLPAPSIFHPELLEPETANPRPRESAASAASCPELVRLGEQSLNVNNRVAVEIGEMLTALLLTNSLKRFATYFDLESGTSRSLYCTPEQIEKAYLAAAQNVPPTKSKRRKKSSGRTQATDFYAR
jgi:PRTRC genetic system ThiF family protein